MMAMLPSCGRARREGLILAACTFLTGCAGLASSPALKVNVVDLESLPGAGLEVRLLVKLRVQNAGDSAIDYDGVSIDLDLRGMSFASGVSPERGTVPRFGEVVIAVPVTISAMSLVRQALSLAGEGGGQRIRLAYAARGRLAGGLFGGHRFESSGEIEWPPKAPAA
jgi:LEA14-like dessication related protein